MHESEHSCSPQPTPTKGRAVEIAPYRASTIKLHIKIPEFKKKTDWFSFLETWMDCSIKLFYQCLIQFSSVQLKFSQIIDWDSLQAPPPHQPPEN